MPTNNVSIEWVDIVSGSRLLCGRVFTPSSLPNRVIIINPATGIRQHYYESFARWLATEHNSIVLTYDYRDFGMNQGVMPIQWSETKMSDWGVKDQDAALSYICERYSLHPIWIIGHSLGGLFLRWHKHRERVQRMITVGSGPAHYRNHPISYQPAAAWFWFVGGPALTKTLGFLPGGLSGLRTDLPAQVYWQWRRWCLSKNFYKADWGYDIPAPEPVRTLPEFTAVALEDDVMVPPDTVAKLGNLYDDKKMDFRLLKPSNFALKKIGHFKAFSKQSSAVWPALVA